MIRDSQLRIMLLSILGVMCCVGLAQAGANYGVPIGGWTYIYEGDQAAAGSGGYTALDGTWSHDNGSDQWDGSAIGSGRPGGVSILTEGAVTYIRVQETGDPRDYGMDDPGSNRKIFLGHSITNESGVTNASTILDDGVILTFRARLSTAATGPVDDHYPDGGGGPLPWPAGGDGYTLHDGGKSVFGIRQSGSGQLVSFAPTTSGLLMDLNNQSLAIVDFTQWHEFWIQIVADGTGTHTVKIWMDGNIGAPDGEFNVTAGGGSDYSDSYMTIGLGSTGLDGAIDVDFIAYKADTILPSPVPGGVFNTPPQVDAGNNQEITMPVNSVLLNGTVIDDGLGDPNGFLSLTWSKISGPGEVTFEPNEFVENPTAVFELHQYGDYVLRLHASDGELDNDDTVTITVVEPDCPVGDLNGDCKVDGQDLEIMMGLWLDDPGGVADLSGNNLVNIADYRYLAGNWLENRQQGALQVTIYPQEVLDDGAQWRVDGGAWKSSGDIVGELAVVDTHNVEFYYLAGWDKPDDQIAQIYYGQTTQADGTYIRHVGSLRVNISPPEAVTAGAQWRIVGQNDWHNSGGGDVVEDLPTGYYQVEFNVISGWIDPGIKDVEITRDELMVLDATYTALEDISLRINEFMASNNSDSGITDEHGDFDDWIEIHNATDASINVGGMHITDDQATWQIPTGFSTQTTIAAGGYLLLWADDEEETEGPLHLAFNLDAGGDEIKLYDYDGVTLLDSITFEDQITNISYGRYPDGTNNWYYFTDPTEGTSNDQAGFSDRVADTKFNPDRGFYDAAFDVTITTATAGVTIYFTIDGAPPIDTSGNPTANAQTYSAGNKPNITTTTCLRAAAVKSGWLPTNIDTQSYFFLADVLNQATHPVTEAQVTPVGYPSSGWGRYGPDYQVDPDIVLHASAPDQLTASDLQSVPTISVAMDVDDLFGSNQIYISGTGDERLASIEMIYGDGSTGFQENGVIEIQGGSSTSRWKSNKLSFQFKFKDRMDNGTPSGGPTKLDYEIYPDSPVDRFDNIILDAVLNNSWNHATSSSQRDNAMYIQDQYTADLHNAMGGYSPRGLFAHLYLNGLYWGMYYVHDRPDHSFAAELFGGDREEYDVIKHSDSTVVNNGVGGAGAADNYSTMLSAATAAGSNPTNLTKWDTLQQNLDVDNLITYLLANWFVGNTDWPHQNWYATHRATDGKWRYHSWDAEHVIYTSNVVGASPSGVHAALDGSPEYRLRFADHIHKHFHNGGVLETGNPGAMYQARIDEADRAIVGESARWGDCHRTNPYTYTEWRNNQNGKINSYFPGRSNTVFNNLSGLYPDTDPPEFEINGLYQHGGYVSSGDSLTIDNPNVGGMIYYTLNGNDPRLPGGAVNTAGGATAYGSAEILDQTVHVKARVLNDSEWSALSEAVFALPTVAQNLRITELMYHPAGDPNAEFIEVMNIHPNPAFAINLSLVKFTNGVYFEFPPMDLYGGQRAVVVKNLAAFETWYGTGINVVPGEYTGSFSNGGEEIDLDDALGTEIHDFDYSDGWYEITDGLGFSLTVRDPSSSDPNDWDRKSGWRASFADGGSPGEDDSAFVLPDDAVIVNELLAHADTLEPNDWIEFYNTTNDPINIGGWFISDNDNDLMKYEIEESFIIPSHSYRVFYADPNFGPGSIDPGVHTPFAFSESGEKVYLTSGSGGEITGVYSTERKFDPSAPDIAFGHYVKSTGGNDFVAMSSNTPGWLNECPLVGPVVITEIAYHPFSDSDAEYVELYNNSGASVKLYDDGKGVPWRFVDDPDDPGLSFSFPSGSPITLADDEYLLLVKDEEAFEEVFLDPGQDISILGVQWLEWGTGNGSLSNGGEQLELQMPGDLDGGVRQYIRVDRVTYDDEAPWPMEPDGYPAHDDGSDDYVLERIDAADEYAEYGNDVINWQADDPTSGEDNDN